jgi:hypothetical protein
MTDDPRQLQLPSVDELITVQQAALILGVTGQMVKVMAMKEQIKNVIRIGLQGNRHFLRNEIEDLKMRREIAQLLTGRRRPGPKRAPAPEGYRRSVHRILLKKYTA